MRLTVCLEGNAEGRVLASLDMEEIVKMTITDDIEKSNFNPEMFKSCTDTSYRCGYEQGRAHAIEEFARRLKHMFQNDEDAEYAKWTVSGVIGEIDDLVEEMEQA